VGLERKGESFGTILVFNCHGLGRQHDCLFLIVFIV
jgi:hypothetical protein